MDLSVKSGDGMLNIRVGAIIKDKDGYCFHYDKEYDFYALIGGRVKYFESSDSAIKREIKEELNIECDDIYFLTTVQNFFEYESTSYHEILFIYHATINESLDDLTLPFDQKIKYVSLKISEIPRIKLLPQKAKEIILKRVNMQPLFIDRGSSK